MATNSDEAAIKERCGQVLQALAACLKDVKDLPRPHHGIIACLKCGGNLHYLAKTSAPGTIWGRCETDGCLSWAV